RGARSRPGSRRCSTRAPAGTAEGTISSEPPTLRRTLRMPSVRCPRGPYRLLLARFGPTDIPGPPRQRAGSSAAVLLRRRIARHAPPHTGRGQGGGRQASFSVSVSGRPLARSARRRSVVFVDVASSIGIGGEQVSPAGRGNPRESTAAWRAVSVGSPGRCGLSTDRLVMPSAAQESRGSAPATQRESCHRQAAGRGGGGAGWIAAGAGRAGGGGPSVV